ncbi:hypothetical protein [Prevotella koreensis]|nr:hypothetical protein [Prevotella koreensis]
MTLSVILLLMTGNASMATHNNICNEPIIQDSVLSASQVISHDSLTADS